MFKHLLVPLDGSHLAEAVLPAAVYMAEIFKARVTLLHIIEQDAPPTVHGERHLTDPVEAEAYLAEVGHRYFPTSDHLERHVHTAAIKDVAHGIVMHEAELKPDLIVMGTHGRGGLHGLLFGRIAQQVLAMGSLPVLMLRSDAIARNKPFAYRRILAPSDGRPSHAQGPSMACDFAKAVGAQLDLLAVVPTLARLTGTTAVASRFAPGSSQAMLEMAEMDLIQHLCHQSECLADGDMVIQTHLERGEPAAVIAAVAERLDVDLIVLATHGKTGTAAFWTQSTGAKVLAKTQRPVLLVPV